MDNRAALTGISFVLHAGLPSSIAATAELGRGSGVTCWRRLRGRQAASMWVGLHRALPERLAHAGRLHGMGRHR